MACKSLSMEVSDAEESLPPSNCCTWCTRHVVACCCLLLNVTTCQMLQSHLTRHTHTEATLADCLQDCIRLYLFAFVAQLLLMMTYLLMFRLRHTHTPAGDVIKRGFETIIHAAPPAVPAVMIFSGGSNIGRLQAEGTAMNTPDLLKPLGETDVIAMDKTGTLTGSAVRPPA